MSRNGGRVPTKGEIIERQAKAIEIAVDLMIRGGFCVNESPCEKLVQEDDPCPKCVKKWLKGKAKKELKERWTRKKKEH